MTGRGRLPAYLLFAGAAALVLSACASQRPKATVSSLQTKEYFAESEYGVKASPRVTNRRSGLKRGGGRHQIGRPYQIKGKWYYPKKEPGYSRRGKASWYGDAFHGRLTANGEIYDMTHLTAAHPTMPLPSYARVTNLKNGTSVIVRVNDRGPFARGRIIDLSKRAAQLLDYKHDGVAKVQVDYIGPAPLHGQDDEYLMASYRPGGARPSDGLPSGVMLAMNSETPRTPELPGVRKPFVPVLPATVPVVQPRPRPLDNILAGTVTTGDTLAYAMDRFASTRAVFGAVDRGAAPMAPADVVASWARQRGSSHGGAYVAVGTFDSAAEARTVAERLRDYGRVSMATDPATASTSVTLHGRDDAARDTLLQAAWRSGAPNAFIVRP